MTDYFTTRETFGRTEKVLDVQRFVRDLAKAMGGTYNAPRKDDMGAHERYGSFDLDGYKLGFTRSWNDRLADKVTVHIEPADLKLTYNQTPSGPDYKLPTASMSASKPMERLVKDIKRRVIDPAKAPAEKRRAYAADLKVKANTLAERAEAFRKNPRLDVRVENGATYSGTIYNRGDGIYLTARFYADGTVSVDRLGTINAEQFEKILATLYPEDK